jgi:hypothetical protein
MTKGRFVAACLKEAFRGGWAIANAAASGLVLLGSFAAWRWPELGGDVNFLMWAVPLVLLVLSLYFSSLLGAHKLYERLAKEPSRARDCSRNKLSGSRPNWPNSNRAGRRKQGSSRFAYNWTGFLWTA